MKQLSRQRNLPTHSITAYGVIVYDFNFNSFVFVGSKDMHIFSSLEKAKQHLAYIIRMLYEKFMCPETYQDYPINSRDFILKGSYEHLNKLRYKLKRITNADAVEKISTQLKLKEIKISDNELVERAISITYREYSIKYKRISDGQYIDY